MPIFGMKQDRGKSRFAGRAFACACIAAASVAALAAPAAFAEPAVDEYTLTLPQASGDQHLPPGAPGTVPGVPGATTPPPTGPTPATDLDGSESKQGLAKDVGEAPELGAPGEETITPTALHTSDRGIPTILADTLNETEGGAPLLLGALAAVTALGVLAAFWRRRSNPRETG